MSAWVKFCEQAGRPFKPEGIMVSPGYNGPALQWSIGHVRECIECGEAITLDQQAVSLAPGALHRTHPRHVKCMDWSERPLFNPSCSYARRGGETQSTPRSAFKALAKIVKGQRAGKFKRFRLELVKPDDNLKSAWPEMATLFDELNLVRA